MQPTLDEFIQELTQIALKSENILSQIEKDPDQKSQFVVFAEWMVGIRGTAQQLQLPRIARIAGLGEELAHKAVHASNRGHIRKCIGSLWDALSTIKHLLIHRQSETNEEEQILVNRLESTLKSLGGARPTFSTSEIEKLLAERK